MVVFEIGTPVCTLDSSVAGRAFGVVACGVMMCDSPDRRTILEDLGFRLPIEALNL